MNATPDIQTHTVAATFQVASWEEETIYLADDHTVEISGKDYPTHGFARADVTYSYDGDVSGTGRLSYLLAYNAEGDAPTFGFEAFEGSIDGHEGTLVLRHNGFHNATGVYERLDIVENLGTGGLAAMRGFAQIEIAGHSDAGYPITFHYTMG
ncbi:DUF3224 domain-containing protein [Gordonia sp. DT30]|uniref:DUF3224 domain-containing protein n=1 Tax=Gordonia sp. DT30 TaxID=3416546 RepID=UPI003CF35576